MSPLEILAPIPVILRSHRSPANVSIVFKRVFVYKNTAKELTVLTFNIAVFASINSSHDFNTQ